MMTFWNWAGLAMIVVPVIVILAGTLLVTIKNKKQALIIMGIAAYLITAFVLLGWGVV